MGKAIVIPAEELQLFMECPTSWNARYNLQVTPPRKSRARAIASAVKNGILAALTMNVKWPILREDLASVLYNEIKDTVAFTTLTEELQSSVTYKLTELASLLYEPMFEAAINVNSTKATVPVMTTRRDVLLSILPLVYTKPRRIVYVTDVPIKTSSTSPILYAVSRTHRSLYPEANVRTIPHALIVDTYNGRILKVQRDPTTFTSGLGWLNACYAMHERYVYQRYGEQCKTCEFKSICTNKLNLLTKSETN